MRLRPHIPVRSDPRLHGKLYWTPAGIVMGSSNASTNGLATEDGLSGWAEANIFSDDPELIATTFAWFKLRKECSYEIRETDLLLEADMGRPSSIRSTRYQTHGRLGRRRPRNARSARLEKDQTSDL